MFDEPFIEWHKQKYRTYHILTRALFVLVFVVPPVAVLSGAIINRSGHTVSGSTSQAGATLLFLLFGFVYIRRALIMRILKRSLWDELRE